jgi:DNA-binding NarL/FixJ family response regulator
MGRPLPVAFAAGSGVGCDGDVMLRCVIIDDSAPFLDAATGLLQREGLEVSGTASSGAQGVRQVDELRPDVVLVDVMLGNESGFDVARLVHGRHGDAPAVILISTHAEVDLADLIDATPAAGFLQKSQLSAAAVERIVSASRGT